MKLKNKIQTQKKLNNLQYNDILPWASDQIKEACSFVEVFYYTFDKEEQAFCLEYHSNSQEIEEQEPLTIQDAEDIFTKV